MFKFLIIYALITTTLSTTTDINCLEVCREKPLAYKLPDPTDCRGYILCHKDMVVQQYCASGTKFDESKQECIVGKCPPCNCDCATCGSSTNTTPTTPTPTPDTETPTPTPSTPTPTPDTPTTTPDGSSPDCSVYPNGTLLPHTEHCRFFWTCLRAKAILRFCELGMWYDRVHFVCNYPELVNCPANQD